MARSEKFSMDQSFLQSLRDIVLSNLENEQFGAEELAKEMGLSRSQIHRKLQKVNGKSITQFIREIKLDLALDLLKKDAGTASEIAYKVGFSSPAYFTKCFHEHFGYTPGEAKYNNSNPEQISDEDNPDDVSPGPTTRQPTSQLPSKKAVLIAFFVAVFLLLIYSLSHFLQPDAFQDGGVKSIALLPFDNNSPEGKDQHIVLGFEEAIGSNLSKVHGMEVMSIVSTKHYRNSPKSVYEIGEELEVGYVLSGSLMKDDQKFRITYTVLDIEKGKEVFSDAYNGIMAENFLTAFDPVAQRIINELNVVLTPEEEKRLAQAPTTQYEAWDYYAQGRSFLAEHISKWDSADLILGEKFIRTALEIDPTYALAYVALGEISKYKRGSYGYFSGSEVSKIYTDSMQYYANRALQIDAELAEAYALRGDYFYSYDKKDEAIDDLKRSISIKKNLVLPYFIMGRIWLDKQEPAKAFYQFHLAEYYEQEGYYAANILHYKKMVYTYAGDFDNANQVGQKQALITAGERGQFQSNVFTNLAFGRFENAEYLADSITKVFPQDLDEYDLYYLMLYTWTDRPEKAIEKSKSIGSTSIVVEQVLDSLKNGKDKPDHLVAYNLAKLGYQDLAQQIFEHFLKILKQNNRIDGLAEVYAEIGDYDKSLENLIKLEQSEPYHPLFELSKHISAFEPLRSDPRYIELIKKVDQRRASELQKIRQIEQTPIMQLINDNQ